MVGRRSLWKHTKVREPYETFCAKSGFFYKSTSFVLVNFSFFFFFRYYETVSDVLSSVKKMEESLKRLKQARRTAALNPVGTNGGMSDDDKIRLQLALDVEYFGEQVSWKRKHLFAAITGFGKGARYRRKVQLHFLNVKLCIHFVWLAFTSV